MLAPDAMLLICLLALNMKGAAWDGARHLITWGDQILQWSLPDLRRRVLASPSAPVGEGGCLDRDGRGLFLQEGDRLVYRRAPEWQRAQVLDHGIDMHNCIVTTLLGRRGVLMAQRGMQVRFYTFPDFHYTEIYSFYSASDQAGLLLADVDGDHRTDILCGNYWIRSPEAEDLPWHDFAIELYNQEHEAAKLSLALDGAGVLTVAQGHLPDGRVAHFRRAADARKLWTEEDARILHYPHALASGLVAENNGPHSRVLIGGREAQETDGVHTAFLTRYGYVLIGAERIYFRR
jgi:hypothetical protein